MDIQNSPQTEEELHNGTTNNPLEVSSEVSSNDEPINEENQEKYQDQSPTEQNLTSSNEQAQEGPSQQNEEGVILEHTIGPHLRKERERLGIQLKNVVQSTKISLTNLENLETDNLDALPDKAYVTGYIKSYSKLLNLDTDEALKLLDYTYEKLGKTQGPQEIVIPQAQNAPQVSMPLPWAKIGVAVGGVILLIAITTGMWMFFSGTEDQEVQEPVSLQEEQVSTDITPQSLSAETPLQDELPEGTPSAEAEQEEAAQQEDLLEAKAENKAEPKKEAKEEVAEIKKEEKKEETKTKKEEKKEEKEEEIKFYGMSKTLYRFDEEMDQAKIDELLPSRFRVTPEEGTHAVFVTASKGDSWLTYKSDDDEVRKFVLKEGRSILIRGQITRLFLGNLGAVNVFLNNRPLKISSPSGVKSLIFPQERSGDYVTPLFIYKKDGSVITSEEYLIEQAQ